MNLKTDSTRSELVTASRFRTIRSDYRWTVQIAGTTAPALYAIVPANALARMFREHPDAYMFVWLNHDLFQEPTATIETISSNAPGRLVNYLVR